MKQSGSGSLYFMQRLYPLTKLFLAAAIVVSSLLIANFVYGYACFLICLFFAWLGGKAREFVRTGRKVLLFLVILIILMQASFYPGQNVLWQFLFIRVTAEGIYYSLVLTSRLVAVTSAFLMFFQTTEVRDFVLSLEKAGLPPAAAYVVLETLQVIPQMSRKAKTIMDAQKARGVETEGSLAVRFKAFLAILGPLVLSSIAGIEEKAITLEARAFSVPVPRTRLHDIHPTKLDTRINVLTGATITALALWRLAAWIL